MSEIHFFENSLIVEEHMFLGFIQAGDMNKREYLETLKKAFNIPDYFSYNWDALDECLSDLDWDDMDKRRCCLVLYSLPAENRDCSILKEILESPEIKIEKVFIHSELKDRWMKI